jgi:hypothetical protein
MMASRNDQPHASQPVSAQPPWLLLAVGGLGACLAYLAVELYLLSGELGLPLDDSWIHLQFARNLAAGEGLTYNPGEFVAGSTAPLWTALLSLVFLLPGGYLLGVKTVGVLLYLAGLYPTYRLGAELGLSRSLALLATVLTMITSWLVWSALSALEVPLFVLLSVWVLVLHSRERAQGFRSSGSLIVAATAVLVRPEGVLLLACAILDRLLWFRQDSRGDLVWQPPPGAPLLAGGAGALIIVVPMILFNLWSSGSALPTTFAAKTAGVSRMLPELGYLYTTLGIFFRPQPIMVLLAAAGVLVLLGRFGGARDRGLLPVLWLLGLPLAYATLDPPGSRTLVGNFGRYFFPLFPVLIVLGTLGLESAAGFWNRRWRIGPWSLRLRALLLVVILIPTVIDLVRTAGRYGQNVTNVQDSDIRVARWLSGRLSPDAVLAVNDVGALKFLLPNRVLDLAGIIHPEARAIGASRFLETHRPDYLVIFPSWFPDLVGENSPFRLVESFPIPHNITMGGDRLAVYATPWTRYALAEVPGEPDSGEVERQSAGNRQDKREAGTEEGP